MRTIISLQVNKFIITGLILMIKKIQEDEGSGAVPAGGMGTSISTGDGSMGSASIGDARVPVNIYGKAKLLTRFNTKIKKYTEERIVPTDHIRQTLEDALHGNNYEAYSEFMKIIDKLKAAIVNDNIVDCMAEFACLGRCCRKYNYDSITDLLEKLAKKYKRFEQVYS